jgi:hypothetical protein
MKGLLIFIAFFLLIVGMETKVKAIAEKVEELHETEYCSEYCKGLSYHGCSASEPNYVCSSDYPLTENCTSS